MALHMSRKKSTSSKRTQSHKHNFFLSFISKIFFHFPTLIILLVFIYIWSSSTTLFSSNIVHVCVSSRKLNNLYCLSAGTQPNFLIPIPLVNETSLSTTVGSEKEVVELDPNASISHENPKINDESTLSTTIGSVKEVVELDPTKASISHDNRKVNDESSLSTTIGSVEEVVELDPTKASIIHEKPYSKNQELEEAYREAEEQLQVQRSWGSEYSNQSKCEGRGIYIYDLPSKFNKDLISQCGDMIPWLGVDFCKFFNNEALGEPLENLGKGWYHTHQYSLEPIFHARILKHPCRVYDHNEAKLFYVPFYGGLDILRWHFKTVSNDVKDALGLELVQWLQTQGPWYRNLGKDHVFVLGKISWDFRRKDESSSWGTRLLELNEMQNPIKLLIERQPWHINDVGIPHPTYFHPQTDDDIIAWQLKIMRTSRRNLVSFAGAPRPDSPDNIRSILIEDCSSTRECKFLNCTEGKCDRPESIIGLFVESEFCLQPPGDSPTRKSVFDSLVSGCIPVLFDPLTAYYQYPWHLPEDRDKYSVYVEKEEARKRSVRVVEMLMKIPLRERENMRRYIVYELLPGLVYGDLNSKFDKFQDAFSITVNNLLQRVNKLNELQ